MAIGVHTSVTVTRLFVNASSWGLLFTGKLVNYSDDKKKEQFNLLKRTVGRLGEPVIRKAGALCNENHGYPVCYGPHTIDGAIERARETEAKGLHLFIRYAG